MYAMNPAARAVKAYGSAAVPTPLQELVQVHDGMIARLAEARRAVAERRFEDRFHATVKVGRVVDVLYASLDLEQGGEVAAALRRLYAYFNRRLIELNTYNDAAICDELMARLGELREAWASLAGEAEQLEPTTTSASMSA
jgi:flagellar protein FliS